MFGKEPALIIAILVAVAQLILMIVTGDPGVVVEAPTDVPEAGASWVAWLTPIFTIIAGVLIRLQVFSPNTLRKAGLSPAKVEKDAKDPSIRALPPTVK